ncbi:hypothetical protein WR25_20641 isoform A [Diploscapter pachys]|uniref:Uncharacterized protein n=1 Tax=Diploscapter pachys TaxID=2018661 RepID=A0A2A2L269_9BILA|nr:hypothetical protein WR25_20641 isoform A [Diploscapter pachys]
MSRDLRENARLERLIGRSPLSPSGIAVNEKTKKVAYLAGKSTIVVSNLNGFGKESHIQGTLRNRNIEFTTLDFSACGRYIATGESGSNACVRIWEIVDSSSKAEPKGCHQIRELQMHSNTISAVKFTNNGHFVISAGSELDGHLVVWDWRQTRSVFQGKISGPVGALAVSPDSLQVVSVGAKSVKYWTLPSSPDYVDKERDFNMRSAILADKRSLVFIDALFISSQRLLVASQDGQVIELVNKKFVRTYTWVDKGLLATCLSLTGSGVAIGFDDGSVRILSIDSESLNHADELRCPLFVGNDPSMVKDPSSFSEFRHVPNGARSASVCAIKSDSGNDLIVAHADRSLVFYRKEDASWMFRGTSQAHVGTVSDIQFYPPQFDYLPRGSFITGGRDGTIKIWNLHPASLAQSSKNLLCPNLIKVIPLEDDYEALVDNIHLAPLSATTGLSCLRISPDGQHLVAGAHNGHLNLVDLTDPDCVHFDSIAAHEGTVTALVYSDFRVKEYPQLLASSGIDHFVHIFRRSSSYQPIYVLSEHHSPVTSCLFAEGSANAYLYTSGLDRLMIQWRIDNDAEGVVFTRDTQDQLPFEMSVMRQSRLGQKVAITCGDGQIRTFEPGQLQNLANQRGIVVDDRLALDNIAFDPSGSYALTIVQDSYIALIDIRNGQSLAVIPTANSSATAASFSNDCKTVLYTSIDGCVFIYRLANAVVSRLAATKRVIEEAMRRTPSPDSLLGSESEDISEFSHYSPPEFDSDTSFEISTAGGHFLSLPVTSRSKANQDNRSSLLPTIQQAQVQRRSTSNLLGVDQPPNQGDVSDYESQSDFISKRTPFVEVPQEATSSSMINLRDVTGIQSARPVLITRNVDIGGQQQNGQLPPKGRRKWTDLPPEPIDTNSNYYGLPLQTDHQQHHAQMQQMAPRTTQFGVSWSPSSVNSTASMTSSISSASSPSYPGGVGQQTNPYRVPQSNVNDTPFGRQNKERESLSKRHIQEGGMNEQRTIWSPLSSSSPASQPRRVSNLSATRNGALPPSGAAAAALLRRPADDYFSSSNLHLRSRSQSPNKLAVQAGLTANSSQLTKGMEQKRRDSDMSYSMIATNGLGNSRSNLRGMNGDETRKSTEALNKLAAVRSKLHQSSENLRKSSDNLMAFNSPAGGDSNDPHRNVRTTSSGNLRHSIGGAGGAQLEPFGTFDVDVRSRSGSMSSLAHSRILARSMGNINASSSNSSTQSSAPRKKLQETLDMLKKASNPDLTQIDQYDDSTANGAFDGNRFRGAVQKRVDRYRPRNRGNMRNQTSEESDSNTSDASPLNQSIRRAGVFGGAMNQNRYGDSSTSACQANRRLYEQQQNRPTTSTPRRTTNYLAQRMNGDITGPDLGSDESPRSSMNPHEWQQLLGSRTDPNSSQLVRHVQDCMDQLQVCADKTVQAKKMIENDSSLSEDVKKVIICQLDMAMERATEKLANQSSRPEDRNGNDYTPIKGPQTYTVIKQNLSNHR